MTTLTESNSQADIQAALNAGGEVQLVGHFVVAKTNGQPYCLVIPDGSSLRGPATLTMAEGTPASTWLVKMVGTSSLEDVTLNGNKEGQVPDTHRHGVFLADTHGATLRHVTASGFTGDGFYLYTAEDTLLEGCAASANDRNGLTMGGDVAGVVMVGCTFTSNAAQQVDSEPAPPHRVTDVTISSCWLDVGECNDYALTISGSATAQGARWSVTNTPIRGGVLITGATDVLLGWCPIGNPTTKPAVDIWRASERIRVLGCRLDCDQTAAPTVPALAVVGTSGSGPSEVVVTGCSIVAATDYAVKATAASSFRLVGNDITGPNHAVLLRGYDPRPFTAEVHDNHFTATTTITTVGIVSLSEARNTLES